MTKIIWQNATSLAAAQDVSLVSATNALIHRGPGQANHTFAGMLQVAGTYFPSKIPLPVWDLDPPPSNK